MDQNYEGKMVILSSQGILKKATNSGMSNDFFFFIPRSNGWTLYSHCA